MTQDVFEKLGVDVEHYLLNFLDPTSYVHFTSTNRHNLSLRNGPPAHYQNVAADTCKMLHTVFDLNRNVIMHGPGGCGKTHALSVLQNHALDKGKYIVMTGTTGVSACGIPDGITIHSFSGLGKCTIPLEKLKQELGLKPERSMIKYIQWKKVDILVIDEVSMMGRRLFCLLDYLARFIRQDLRPFGGIQLVLSGDFLQLPPVGDQFIFTSEAWREMNFITVPFLTPYRQRNDRMFFKMLQRVRMGMTLPSDIKRLESRVIEKIPDFVIENVGKALVPPFMFSRHRQVNALNSQRLESFAGDIYSVNAIDTFYKMIREHYPSTNKMTVRYVPHPAIVLPPSVVERIEHRQARVLPLKHMAQYVITQNINGTGASTNYKVVNGSMALMMRTEQGDYYLQLRNGYTLPLEALRLRLSYCVSPREGIYMRREQYVIRVGYAVTIHSAQGMTLDQAVVDAGSSIFASAQTYVACSRVRRLEDLYLLAFHVKSLKVHEEARRYVAKLENVDIGISDNGNLNSIKSKSSSSSSSSSTRKRKVERDKGEEKELSMS
jgi:ATP-dependent DNA helicase PIF1